MCVCVCAMQCLPAEHRRARARARDDDDTFMLSRLYLFNILRHLLCCFRYFLFLFLFHFIIIFVPSVRPDRSVLFFPISFRCPFYASDLNVKNRFRTLTMSLFSVQFSVVERWDAVRCLRLFKELFLRSYV